MLNVSIIYGSSKLILLNAKNTVFFNPMLSRSQEVFEDTKGVIQIRNRRTDSTMVNRTNNDPQNIHIKPKIEHTCKSKPQTIYKNRYVSVGLYYISILS